jgi:hypothetical protein
MDGPTAEAAYEKEIQRGVSDQSPEAPNVANDSEKSSLDEQLATTTQLEKVDSVADVPPDGGYGWVVVGCLLWINANSWGVNGVSLSQLRSASFQPRQDY